MAPPCVVWFASGYACVPACTNEADEGRAMQRAGRWYTRCPVACSRHQRLLGAKSGIPRCSEWVCPLRYPRACLTAPAGQQGSHQLRGQRFLPKMCVTWAHLLKNDPGPPSAPPAQKPQPRGPRAPQSTPESGILTRKLAVSGAKKHRVWVVVAIVLLLLRVLCVRSLAGRTSP